MSKKSELILFLEKNKISCQELANIALELTKQQEELENQKQSLEECFIEIHLNMMEEINAQIEIAAVALNEAVKISEKYGIPFKSVISPFEKRVYWPVSLKDKWKELGQYNAMRLTECYPSDMTGGWEYWNSSSLSC
jgi:hypothetical protein